MIENLEHVEKSLDLLQRWFARQETINTNKENNDDE